MPGWLARLPRGLRAGDRRRRRLRTAPTAARHVADDRARAGRVLRARFAPDGAAVVQRAGDPTFLSNVNACYRRDCWEAIRFADVPYSEDQAFARALLAAGWAKAYHPGARRSCTRTTTRPSTFMRRYFDEYRGLRETIGHVEGIGVRSTLRDVRGLVAADRRWMRERGLAGAAATPRHGRSARCPPRRRASSSPRSARGPTGCPRRCSARSRSRARRSAGPPADRRRRGRRSTSRLAADDVYDAIAELVARRCRAPLLDPVPGMATRTPAARRGRDPAVPARQRRALRRSSRPALAARASAATPSSIWLARPDRAGTRDEWPAVDPRQHARVLRADLRARSSRASTSGTAPTSCSRPGWQTRSTRCMLLRRLPRAGLPGPGPRAGVLRHLGRVRWARADLHRTGLHCDRRAVPWLAT